MQHTHMHTVTHIHAERRMRTHMDRDMGTRDTDMCVMDLGEQAHTQTLKLTMKLLQLGSSNVLYRASLVAQLVRNPPAMQKTPVQFLG